TQEPITFPRLNIVGVTAPASMESADTDSSSHKFSAGIVKYAASKKRKKHVTIICQRYAPEAMRSKGGMLRAAPIEIEWW
ncbi:hypothetical protein, partial [Streptomyces sp. SID5770]|uniref:hypothetical protein n=1 Tax=Streptomyces sp. SID5770 TaxID=2690308 RepID=UPI001F408380